MRDLQFIEAPKELTKPKGVTRIFNELLENQRGTFSIKPDLSENYIHNPFLKKTVQKMSSGIKSGILFQELSNKGTVKLAD